MRENTREHGKLGRAEENMERLTTTSDKGGVAFTFNLDITCDKSEIMKILKLAEKLKEYEDLEEQGKLLKLPCAVGDTVWDIDFGRPCSYEVTGFSFGSLNDDDWEEKVLEQVMVHYTNSSGSITGTFAASEIGKTVFLTKESAEAAVKELRGG